MTAEQFALWFQGFAELTPEPPNAAQWALMRAHVATVFDKVTPPLDGFPRDKLQEEISELFRRRAEETVNLRPRRSVSRDRLIC